MARIPEHEVARLKAEVSVQRLAEARGIRLERRGADLFGLCIFHEDHNPSLVISPGKNLWHCLGCGEGGSVIDWVKECHGVSFTHMVPGYTVPNIVIVDLLDTSLQLQLTANPHALESLIGKRPSGAWIVLDEVQKIPALLDEVHRLSELRRWRFALCGSSARKLKRGGANLLAGRALTLSMEPFCSAELGEAFDRDYSLDWGMLPIVQMDRSNAPDILSAYVDTYLKEEIRTEGVIRSFPPFARFLSIAGQMNGQMLNMQNIAREASIPRSSVDGYFSVLTDTLMAHFLPPYRPGLKVRETAHPKFFWVDAGIARAASGLLRDTPDRTWKGAALETLIFHELRVYNSTSGKHRPIAFYRTPAGSEINFVIETQKQQPNNQAHVVCIEVKLSPRWERKWERAMRDLRKREGILADKMIGVYTGERIYRFDKLDVWPVEEFLRNLHKGKIY